MSAVISQKLQSSRKELLDIGLRNNMLNFRKTAKTLMVVDERSEEVFNILYRQEKAMTFAPMARKRLAELAKAASLKRLGMTQQVTRSCCMSWIVWAGPVSLTRLMKMRRAKPVAIWILICRLPLMTSVCSCSC